MSNLLFLTKQDFQIQYGQQNQSNLLCHSINGFSMFLFYSPQCPHCQQLLPIFQHLAKTLNGCRFAIINVSQNRELVGMSKITNTEIEYVPYMILYVNGVPYHRYDGANDYTQIQNYIIQLANDYHERLNFGDRQAKQAQREKQTTTIGIPLYGDDEDSYERWNMAVGEVEYRRY